MNYTSPVRDAPLFCCVSMKTLLPKAAISDRWRLRSVCYPFLQSSRVYIRNSQVVCEEGGVTGRGKRSWIRLRGRDATDSAKIRHLLSRLYDTTVITLHSVLSGVHSLSVIISITFICHNYLSAEERRTLNESLKEKSGIYTRSCLEGTRSLPVGNEDTSWSIWSKCQSCIQ